MSLPTVSASAWRRFHGIATLVWASLIIPTILIWHDSVLWVGLMSVYACVIGHASAWQASRAEVQVGG